MKKIKLKLDKAEFGIINGLVEFKNKLIREKEVVLALVKLSVGIIFLYFKIKKVISKIGR